MDAHDNGNANVIRFDDARRAKTPTSGCETVAASWPSQPARVLTPRQVRHRQRMLAHLASAPTTRVG